MENETWYVTQDGRGFYVEYGATDEMDSDVDYFEYPWPIEDGNMDDAAHARNWFLATIKLDTAEVVWK